MRVTIEKIQPDPDTPVARIELQVTQRELEILTTLVARNAVVPESLRQLGWIDEVGRDDMVKLMTKIAIALRTAQ